MNKIKIAFKTVKVGNFEFVIPQGDSESSLNVNVSSSTEKFPTATVSLKITNISQKSIFIRKFDKIEIFFSNEGTDYYKAFSGEVGTYKLKFNQNEPATLEITECISSFFKLQFVTLNINDLKNIEGFRSFLKHLMNIAKIECDLVVDSDVSDTLSLGYIYKFNGFTLLQDILIQKDLIMSSHIGNDYSSPYY